MIVGHAKILGQFLFLHVALGQGAKIGSPGLSQVLKEQKIGLDPVPKGSGLVGITLVGQGDPLSTARTTSTGTRKQALQFLRGQKPCLLGFGFQEALFEGSHPKGIFRGEDLDDFFRQFSR